MIHQHDAVPGVFQQQDLEPAQDRAEEEPGEHPGRHRGGEFRQQEPADAPERHVVGQDGDAVVEDGLFNKLFHRC